MNENTKFDYYYGIEADQFSFYRVPRLLIKDERFKGQRCQAPVWLDARSDVTVYEKWMARRGKQGVYHLYGGCDYGRFGMCESNLCQDYERAGFRKRDWVD